MEGLSKKEMEIVSYLEFKKKYFFTRDDIKKFFSSYNQFRHTMHKLIQKKRIIILNKNKYYLIPIKAKSGLWAEHPFIIVDEICNSKDYFIGGWSAANYWRLTDQIPMQVDIYTTRRQGKIKILSTRIVFHRTSKKRTEHFKEEKIENHTFRIEEKEDSKKWIKSKK